MLRKMCAAWLAPLLLLALTGAANNPTADAAQLEADIERLAQELMRHHSVTEKGDYSWLDALDFDPVDELCYQYDIFLSQYGAAAAALVANGAELTQMGRQVNAALAQVDALLQEVTAAQQAVRLTTENYRAAYAGEVAALRARVERMPMSEVHRGDALARIGLMEESLRRVLAELAGLAAKLNALNPEALRFDAVEEPKSLLLQYAACSAEARTQMACRERAAALSARLTGLEQVQLEYAALLAAIPLEAREGSAVPYTRKARLAELSARYSAMDAYTRGRLDAELGGARPLFHAALSRIEERTRAVRAVAHALGELPGREHIVQLGDDATAACRGNALAAQAMYYALLEEAERAELRTLTHRLEEALLATEQFTVTVRTQGEGAAWVQGPVYYGKECLVQAQAAPGWRAQVLSGVEAAHTGAGWRFPVYREQTVTAHFVRQRHAIALEAVCTEGEACTLFGVAQAPVETEHGAAAECIVTPEDSHKISAVAAKMNGEAVAPAHESLSDKTERYTLRRVTGPAALRVVFEPRMLCVETRCMPQGGAEQGGSISPGQTVRWGGAFAGTATAEPGYRLAGVLAGEAPVPVAEDGAFTVYDIRTDVVVTALFEVVEQSEGGTGSRPAGGKAARGWENIEAVQEAGAPRAPIITVHEGAPAAPKPQAGAASQGRPAPQESAPAAKAAEAVEPAPAEPVAQAVEEQAPREQTGGRTPSPLPLTGGALALALGAAAWRKRRAA